MEQVTTGAVRLAVAALAGLAVGMEREWSGHASGPHGRFAGIRTFLLVGLTAGVGGWLASLGQEALAVVLTGGVAAFAVAAWVRATALTTSVSADDPLDATTELAALAVLALGVLAGLGHLQLAAGATAVVLLALSEKARIHAFVRRVDERELRAGLQFAVLALVILPLVPAGPYGPFEAVRPRELWVVVLIFSGLNFAGYLARRVAGQGRGYAVTGLLGGLVSSTAVALGFSRQSRGADAPGRALALGVVGACVVLLFRLAVVTGVINAGVAVGLLPYLLPPLVAGLAVMLVAVRQGALEGGPDANPANESPLGLGNAVRLALLLQLALLAVEFAGARLGQSGIRGLAFMLGLTDMDALTFSMARRPEVAGGARVAAEAIAVGLLANTLLKGALAGLVGRGEFRRLTVAGLGVLAAATAAALLLW